MSFDPLLKMRQASPGPYAPHAAHHGDQTPSITIADARIDDLVDRVAALEAENKRLWLKLRQGFMMVASEVDKVHLKGKK